jgi:hypothetical protein
MGSIQIFALEYSGTKLACSRSFDGAYHLRAGDYTVPMTPQTAHALAEGGRRIRTKAQVASHFGREMKAGVVFRRDMLAVDGRTVHLEFGISDMGDVFLEIAGARMTLTGEQAQLLLAVLDQLGADVSSISSASEQPIDINLTPGLRNLPPRWTDDGKW